MNDLENGADMLVRVQDLRKNYDGLTAVDGISFSIRRGEIFGLLGPNGAGKTTTISMLAGILPATSGAIIMDTRLKSQLEAHSEAQLEGQSEVAQEGAFAGVAHSGAGKRSQAQTRRLAGGDAVGRSVETRRVIGVVPQELAIYNRMTGRENLAFFGELYGLRGTRLQSRIGEMLALVGLADRADDRAEAYSGGMKRRLNLAVGLMHSPRLLLMDEPTVGVDPQSRNHIFEGVRALNRAGLTVLYTSHYMEEVQALCDRVGIMVGGKLIACGPVQELIATLGSATIEGALPTGRPSRPCCPACAPWNTWNILRIVESVERVQSMEDGEVRKTESGVTCPAVATSPCACRRPALNGMACLLIRTRRPNLALPAVVATLNALACPCSPSTSGSPALKRVPRPHRKNPARLTAGTRLRETCAI